MPDRVGLKSHNLVGVQPQRTERRRETRREGHNRAALRLQGDQACADTIDRSERAVVAQREVEESTVQRRVAVVVVERSAGKGAKRALSKRKRLEADGLKRAVGDVLERLQHGIGVERELAHLGPRRQGWDGPEAVLVHAQVLEGIEQRHRLRERVETIRVQRQPPQVPRSADVARQLRQVVAVEDEHLEGTGEEAEWEVLQLRSGAQRGRSASGVAGSVGVALAAWRAALVLYLLGTCARRAG